MLQCEGWTGAVAQQAIEPRSVCALDAHLSIHREAFVVRPGTHLGGVILVDQLRMNPGAIPNMTVSDRRPMRTDFSPDVVRADFSPDYERHVSDFRR